MIAPPSPGVLESFERRSRTLRWLLSPIYLLHAACVWLLILRPPRMPPGVELDASWKELVAFDYLNRWQAGVEFLFTYGPFGYFVPSDATFVPELYWQRLYVDCGLSALIAIAMVLPVLCMPRLWHQFVYLLVVLVTTPIADNAFMLMAMTGVTLWLVLGRRGPLAAAPALVVFVALGMAKFTYFMLGGGCVGLLTLSVWRSRGWRQALVVPATFVIALLGIWVVAGQSLANLPAFVKGSLEITSGYSQSMRWVADDGRLPHLEELLLAVLPIAIATLGALLVGAWRPWQLPKLLGGVAIVAVLFLAWKSGFVRQDAGHMNICYCCAAVVPLWLWSLPRPSRGGWIVDGIVLLAVGIAFTGAFRNQGSVRFEPDNLLPLLRNEAEAHWRMVRDPEGELAIYDAKRARVAAENRLPRVQAAVGTATVDEAPHGQNILFLNRLNVHHRPVFQSYSVYTPYLQRLNGEFYEDPARAPKFVLLKWEPIDVQVPTVADSQMIRVLVRDYRPRLQEGGYLLLERAAAAASPPLAGRPGQREIQHGSSRLGEWVALPEGAGLGELAIDLAYSLRGTLWNLGFRGPRLYMDVRLADDRQIDDFVTSVGLMQLPFILDPLVRDLQAFTKIYVGAEGLPRVTAFRLRPRAGRDDLYEPEYRYTFWRSDLPPPLDPSVARELRIGYPMFDRGPNSIAPAKSFHLHTERGRSVLVAEAPSEMVFEVSGHVVVTGLFGVRYEAYEDRGDTDGVTFRVERVAADGQLSTLFERRLEPKTNAGDRGPQDLVCEAHMAPGDRFVLRTLPGPSLNWDWSYWTDLEFVDLAATESSRMLSANCVTISLAEGGRQVFTLDAGPTHANRSYRLAGTSAGTVPGSALFGAPVPLNASPYRDLTLGEPDPTVFEGFRGRLDANGRATAVLHLPIGGLPGGSERRLHHAFALLGDDGSVLTVSNTVPLLLR